MISFVNYARARNICNSILRSFYVLYINIKRRFNTRGSSKRGIKTVAGNNYPCKIHSMNNLIIKLLLIRINMSLVLGSLTVHRVSVGILNYTIIC